MNNVYVWEGDNITDGYHQQAVIAFAPTAEEARTAIRNDMSLFSYRNFHPESIERQPDRIFLADGDAAFIHLENGECC